MIHLRQWMEREGAKGRRRVLEAIRAEYPKFTNASLSNYIKGNRIPELRIAEIISQVTGIPLLLLSFRATHRVDRLNRSK